MKPSSLSYGKAGKVYKMLKLFLLIWIIILEVLSTPIKIIIKIYFTKKNENSPLSRNSQNK
jgi:hypothetical protein